MPVCGVTSPQVLALFVFRPLSPQQALDALGRSGIQEPKRIIIEFAAAGIIETRAIAMETVEATGWKSRAYHIDIEPALWRRMEREDATGSLWETGTVRLTGPAMGREPSEVVLTGIRFNALGLARIVRYEKGDIVEAKPRRSAPERTQAAADETDEQTPKKRRSRIPKPEAIDLGATHLTLLEAQTVLRCGHTKFYDLINSGRLERVETDAGKRITTKSVKAVLGISD